MSIIVIDKQIVHYEVFGRGRPVLFLHGWMGSWRYWFPTIEKVARYFRTYSFDFWGFGHSSGNGMQESIQNYSDQVVRFLDELGIYHVSLVGHSMGGMVALKTAIDHPERISRITTVGAPIHGKSISWMLKLTSNHFLAETFAHSPWLRRFLFNFFLGSTHDPAAHEIVDDSLKSSADTLHYAVRSMLGTDLRPELPNLRVPSLIVHGARDDIVTPDQANLFQNIAQAQIVLMSNSRHFPFLDNADEFNDLLLQFLKQTSFPSNSSRREIQNEQGSTHQEYMMPRSELSFHQLS